MSHHTAQHYLQQAAKLALKGMKKGDGGPFGAVVVKDGKVVGKGWNKTFGKTDPTAHAEVTAIRDACKNLGVLELAGCTIYSSGEPCPMCMAAIYWTMMDSVYFSKTKEESYNAGFDDSKIYRELRLPWNERHLQMVHYPCDEATEAFNEWGKMMQKNIKNSKKKK